MAMTITGQQRDLLKLIEGMNSWGGFYTEDYQTWKAIKRLHARRLVKRADRCRNWNDQFWYLTDAGSLALSRPERGGAK